MHTALVLAAEQGPHHAVAAAGGVLPGLVPQLLGIPIVGQLAGRRLYMHTLELGLHRQRYQLSDICSVSFSMQGVQAVCRRQ